jgi:hypothetical protein
MAKLVKAKRRTVTSDLEILHPERTVIVRGEGWVMREYTLLEAARLYDAGTKLIAQLEMAAPDVAALVHMLAVATGHGEIEIAALPDEDLARLQKAWEELNLPIFAELAKKSDTPGARWRDVYATLLTHGHRLADIATYTARQIGLFYDAAKQVEADGSASRIRDVNHGFAGGKEASALIRKLEKRSP